MIVTTATIILSLLFFVGSLSISIIGYFLRNTMDDVKQNAILSQKTQSELDVLKTDHKNKHEFITEKFDDLKDVIIKLTDKIEELTAKIK